MATKKSETTTSKVKAVATKVKTAVKKVAKPKAKKLKCVWALGTPCGGATEEKELFNKEIKIPICDKHLGEHKEIMILEKNNYDLEEILQQTPEWRKQEVLTLVLSGLNPDDVEV